MTHAIETLEKEIRIRESMIQKTEERWEQWDTSQATSTKKEVIQREREKITELTQAIEVLKSHV